MAISTHVLDTVAGRPAAGITTVLSVRAPSGDWSELSRRVTDADGRVPDLAETAALGTYRLSFDTESYYAGPSFYPEVTVCFRITEAGAQHHVPLLLSPFGYATYRGS